MECDKSVTITILRNLSCLNMKNKHAESEEKECLKKGNCSSFRLVLSVQILQWVSFQRKIFFEGFVIQRSVVLR